MGRVRKRQILGEIKSDACRNSSNVHLEHEIESNPFQAQIEIEILKLPDESSERDTGGSEGRSRQELER